MKYLRDIILEEKFSLTLYKGQIKISNYQDLEKIETNEIIVTNKYEKILIKRINLTLKKKCIDELLISGKIEDIKIY